MRRRKGFTLLEVLIGAVLIIIGVGSIGLTAVSLRRFFKESENRSRAMLLASTKIEECLAKGYSALEVTQSPLRGDDDGFSWSVQVSALTAIGTKANIPYKKAEAVVSYTADRGRGGINSIKNVRLTNIVPYPSVHTESVYVGGNADIDNCSGCFVPPDKGSWAADPEESQYRKVKGESRLEIMFDYAVKKDIKAAYTISIITKDEPAPDNLSSLDTIYSTLFLEDERVAQVPCTPIMSQPTFNLIYPIKDVPSGLHTISVRWVKRTGDNSPPNSAGKIWLVSGSLSIIATEVE